jgi:predicted signal transduction protein with EAL and GGDEF domain
MLSRMPAFTEPRAKSDETAEPIWAGSLLPVIAALIFGILVGNGAVYLLLPQAMRNVVSAGLGAADAEAQGRLIAFAIVAVSCSLGAAACLMLDLARRHMREHAAALQVARARDMFDSLTGALHRRRFKERLDMSLAGAPAGAFVTLHLIDIEGFSGINDQHGQEAGDTVLRTTAARLAGQAFADQIVGRLGADVFALAVFSATPRR